MFQCPIKDRLIDQYMFCVFNLSVLVEKLSVFTKTAMS